MAKTFADHAATTRFAQGRDVIWTNIRALGRGGKGFTVSAVAGKCGEEINRATIKTYMTDLARAGVLDQAPGAPGKAAIYTLIGDPGGEAPRVTRHEAAVARDLRTEAMWRTMKKLSAFTAGELALCASTFKTPVGEIAAKDYLKYMKHAGYVREVAKAVSGAAGKPARYAFMRGRDPGPKPPRIQRVKRVVDPNTNTVVWPKSGKS